MPPLPAVIHPHSGWRQRWVISRDGTALDWPTLSHLPMSVTLLRPCPSCFLGSAANGSLNVTHLCPKEKRTGSATNRIHYFPRNRRRCHSRGTVGPQLIPNRKQSETWRPEIAYVGKPPLHPLPACLATGTVPDAGGLDRTHAQLRGASHEICGYPPIICLFSPGEQLSTLAFQLSTLYRPTNLLSTFIQRTRVSVRHRWYPPTA